MIGKEGVLALNGKLCVKIDECPKINMLRDKDLSTELFTLCVYNICSKCPDRVEPSGMVGLHSDVRNKVAKFLHDKDLQLQRYSSIESFDECPPVEKQYYYKEADQVIGIVTSSSNKLNPK